MKFFHCQIYITKKHPSQSKYEDEAFILIRENLKQKFSRLIRLIFKNLLIVLLIQIYRFLRKCGLH